MASEIVCKGSIMLGSGCGTCSRCKGEIKKMRDSLKKHKRQPLKPEYLIAAKDMLGNAKQNLTFAVTALQKTGGDFSETISAIKETIGDLECALLVINEYEK